MSISGMEMRPGLRKRSKISLLGSGSRLVMPLVYATIELAPEPRMFHQMSCSLAKRVRSDTMRKYVSKPILWMTSSS